MNNEKVALVWLRRDLRASDNKALEAAVASGLSVVPVFVFDPGILELLPNSEDRRVEFIIRSLRRVESELGPILCFYCKPKDAFKWILDGGLQAGIMDGIDYLPGALFFNEDYETFALKRDSEVEEILRQRGVQVFKFTDQVIFSPDDSRIRKPDGSPYTIYTPYSKRWRVAYEGRESASGNGSRNVSKRVSGEISGRGTSEAQLLLDSPTLKLFGSTPTPEQIGFKTIQNLGFEDNPEQLLLKIKETIPSYHKTRDIPALDTGTTKIGIHLRFGTISIREAVAIGAKLNDTWLGELIWREFFMHIIKHFPYSEEAPFKKQYNFIPWRDDQQEIEAWMRGETGYPLVDAGMRELNETGHMHNRVRMVVASFLTKHLLTDWRIGESYFAAKLNDYELSSNVGNWQWAAGTGCDAAPYFRIFNPSEQARKFDPQGSYIRRWVPEAMGTDGSAYISPIVEHKFARERALAAYLSSRQ
ncbi:deoxyribodipyrimidine photo-lyase [Bacteroidales bacterium MB20-C3-3]|nr:deoxyribodipyrimidine photo-lyase [Bacteroidales bacterium MB20-C3-3]